MRISKERETEDFVYFKYNILDNSAEIIELFTLSYRP